MIINLTQHAPTEEQRSAGVVGLQDTFKLHRMLNFEVCPTPLEVRERADQIAAIAAETDCRQAMIGGALWLMAPLASALRARGIEPMFAFSTREVEEQEQPDGSIRKVTVFRHAGFVQAA